MKAGRISLIISIFALLLSLVGLYIEFFYQPSRVYCSFAQYQIGKDSSQVNFDIETLIINQGKKYSTIVSFHPFLATTKADHLAYDDLVGDQIVQGSSKEVFLISEPSSMKKVKVESSFSLEEVFHLKKQLEGTPSQLYLMVYYMDMDGKKYEKSIQVGTIDVDEFSVGFDAPREIPAIRLL